ncbi:MULTISPECIES: phosphoenolpyruvate--protein phosphotransferase [Thermococcus]|uniref:Phosphoenolpyruvate-protein phosphotransferase n=2 Tax=Thermococcus TaxID=2263 RepID=A0A101EKB3_9EURY|nr:MULTISPECIES: phosphoenolpyruvate--protein phosphotransferase [Thermococcus]KUK16962.1 MAG: Phosphoenolpyruvate-protein phosphotransferase [Thermococcus sibiricus]
MEIIKLNPRYIVSEGYAYGTLKCIEREIEPSKDLEIALDSLRESAKRLIRKLDAEYLPTPETLEIREIHKMILNDPLLWSEIESHAKNGKISIEELLKVRDKIINMLLETKNPLIMERQYDIKDIFNALITEISGEKRVKISPTDIVYLEEVYPSDVVELYKNRVGAILSRKGSHTSHAAILAMSLEIPYIYNVPDLHRYKDHQIFVDAVYGKLIIDPTPEQEQEIQKIINEYQKEKKELEKYSKLRFEEILVMANIGFPQEIEIAKKKGADGVGLFRTEFLFLNREHPPSEEEQFLIYKKVLEAFYPDMVIIRLLDIGGDKQIPYIEMPREENPFLGVRGIRFLLKHKDILITQLRALLRASRYGNLGILIPMVTKPEEVISVKKIIEKVREEIEEKSNFKIGIMVEVPAVIFSIEEFVPYIDFVSIGTNDLTQYMFAADRNNIEVSEYYDDESNVILTTIKLVADKLSKTSIPIAVCGELAGKPHMVEPLLKIGVKEFSVTPSKIPKIKKQIYNVISSKAYSKT